MILCVMLTVLSAPGLAQDLSKERTKKRADVTKDLQRTKQNSSALDKDKTKEKSDLATGPQSKTDIFEQKETRSPEEIDRILQEIEAKNTEMISQLDQIIAGNPYSDNKPDWMFQKAELMWESQNWDYRRARSEYDSCLGAVDKGSIDESECKEPSPDYSQPQAIYEDILKQYPSYERLDEVIYRLGRGLIEAGKGAKAVTLLERLVQNYPNSQYKPEAHLALGEFYFDKNIFTLAATNYNEVIAYEDYAFREYARYKMGWVHYNQQEWRKSIETFKAVVENPDSKLGFQGQAINDLVVAFAQVDDGWKEAREYFLKYDKERKANDKEFAYKQMGRMAGYLEQQGQDDDAVSIYEWFLKERPNHKRVPSWMESIIIAKKKDVNNLEETEASMNRFIAYLAPSGTWAQKNKDEEGAINNAELLTEASLSYLSNLYHVRAQKMGDEGKKEQAVGDYKKAAGYYEQFIKRFPNKPASFDMNFLLGEIYLFDLNRLEDAASQYQKVVNLYKEDKIPEGVPEKDAKERVKDAAYATVNAYNELVKTNCQDSILVRMAEAAENSKSGVYKTKSKMDLQNDQPNPRVKMEEVCKFELGFVQASDQWSEMYPKEDVTPTVDYVSAEVYKARGHYDKSIPRYESIIINAPKKHRYRSFAGASLLDANYRLKKWDEVEKWARYLLDNKIFDVTPKEGLQQTIAFAINSRAVELKDAGNTDKAATELLRLADEFPDSELAPGAVFNAAAIYESGDQINKAIDTYERVVKMRPKGKEAAEKQNEKAAEALFVMGAIFESRADFDRAASYFERLAEDKYRDRPQSADAVYNAGVLREAMEQWGKAIEVYEKYVDLYGKGTVEADVAKNVRTIRLRTAYLEKEQEDWKASLKRFERFLKDSKDVTPAEKIEVYTEIGLLHEKIGGKRWEKNQDDAFKKVFDTFGKLPDDMKKESGKSQEQRKAEYYVSQAKFHQAERIYREFENVKLEYPMSKLIKRLTTKGELEQKAEQIYFDIIAMKSPFWVSAAAYRIGQMYHDFSNNLYNLPMPEGLTPDQEDMYRMQLDEYAFPLQEKALAAFQRARELALELEAYNEWSSKSSAMISQLEKSQYPITSQDGVETSHSRVLFTRTAPVVKVEVASERLKAREAERLAKEAEEERKRKEAEEAAAKKAAEEAAKQNGGAPATK